MLRSFVKKMQDAGKFLSNPILQYIPISIYTLGKSDNWANPYSQPSSQFFLFQDAEALQSALTRYQIPQITILQGGEMYVLCLNFRADVVLFRYLTCKLIGNEQIGSYHVFAITKKYFPRRQIHFAMYDHDGRKLRFVNQEIY